MGWVFGLLEGIKVEIARVHLRYEDDYFNHHRPFSLGVCIDAINFDSSQTHWTFREPNGMQFDRTSNKYVNKEFNIARLRVYFNSFSEMLIPTSLWEATMDQELSIFSAMGAGEVNELMSSVFLKNAVASVNHFNLCEPLYVNIAINLNNLYNPAFKDEPFKYQIVILVSKTIFTFTPTVLKDLKQLSVYFETFSYSKDLKRYRPNIKISDMIDACKKSKNSPEMVQKKKAVIRDWFRLVLWYVRLRKASRGVICPEL